MNIGDAAKATGLSVKMIRHYESVGLIAPPVRTLAGYRVYRDADLRALRFVSRARSLGFSVERMQGLLNLWRNPGRPSAEVKRTALEHVAELEAKIAEMEAMAVALRHLAASCHGDAAPDCAILDDLTAEAPAPRRPALRARFDGVARMPRDAARPRAS